MRRKLNKADTFKNMENPLSSKSVDYGSTSIENADAENLDTSSSHSNVSGYQRLSHYKKDHNHHHQQQHSIFYKRKRHFVNRMTVDLTPNSETHQIVERVEFFFNIINQMCIGFVTIYMSWLCLRMGLQGTALHAWLVTVGFSFLMAEAIMCHYSGNVLTYNYRRNTKTTIHWVLQALGGGLGVAGTLIKLIQKGFLLTTTHGKLGFSAFIICLFTLISGLSALFSMRVKRFLNPLLNKTLHNVLGMITFTLALLAQYYGYQTGFFGRKTTEDFQLLMKCITLVSLVLSSLGPLKALYHRTCNIIRHFI